MAKAAWICVAIALACSTAFANSPLADGKAALVCKEAATVTDIKPPSAAPCCPPKETITRPPPLKIQPTEMQLSVYCAANRTAAPDSPSQPSGTTGTQLPGVQIPIKNPDSNPPPPGGNGTPPRAPILAATPVEYVSVALLCLGLLVVLASLLLHGREEFVFRRHWGGFGGESSGWNLSSAMAQFVGGLVLIGVGSMLAMMSPPSNTMAAAANEPAAPQLDTAAPDTSQPSTPTPSPASTPIAPTATVSIKATK